MRIEKQNMNNGFQFDSTVIVKQNATPEDWRKLMAKAENKGIMRFSGIDKMNRCYFKTTTGFRFTLID
jgi:hypothetical protein